MIKGQVIAHMIDENGNIKVQTEYTLSDGSRVTGYTHYDAIHFTKEKVIADIKQHCEKLMRKTYMLKRNQEELGKVDLSDVVYNCESAEILLKPELKDTAGNITQQKEVIIADDK
ncbi:MAG: hypothetical protein WC444_07200 [Candidatus Paceibacterota bacterium]